MEEIFKRRRQAYYAQNLKYLRYVFNDHFMLFLLIAFAALSVQYGQFLQHNTLDLLIRLLIGLLVSLIGLLPGKLATFLLEADSTFLLPKEEAVKAHLKRCRNQSLLFPGGVILILVLAASPAVKLNIFGAAVWFVLLVGIKAGLLTRKLRGFQQFGNLEPGFLKFRTQDSGNLDWEALIDYEDNRKTSLLKIFSLFTNVKGISSHAKRRKYLDFLLPKKERNTYGYLYWRSFLRSGDYLGLSLRLLLISGVGIAFISNIWAALIFGLLFDYLLIFQLLNLSTLHENQLFMRIYPLTGAAKRQALQNLIMRVLILVSALQFLVLVITQFGSVLPILLPVAANGLGWFYIKVRLKNKR